MSDDETRNELVSKELEEVLDKIPDEEVKKQVKKSIIMSVSSSGIVQRKHPFDDILNEQHLNKIIDNTEKESERDYLNKKYDRKYIFATLIVILLFILVLVYLLAKENSSLLMQIITPLITLVTGAFGGYGLGYKKGQSELD